MMKYNLKYRTELVVNFIWTLMTPLAIIVLWLVVNAATGTTSVGGYSGGLLFTYFIIASAVGGVVMATGVAYGMQSDIQSGSIINNLLRPLSYPLTIFAENVSDNLLNTMVFTLFPTIVLVILLFHPPLTLFTITAFFLEIVSVFIMTSIFFFIIGCLSVYLTNINGIINLVQWALNALGGYLIPISMMPQGMAKLVEATPMYLIYYLPAATFTGTVSTAFIIASLVMCAEWTAVFFVVAVIFWWRIRAKTAAVGG